jgi:hypothetical protein
MQTGRAAFTALANSELPTTCQRRQKQMATLYRTNISLRHWTQRSQLHGIWGSRRLLRETLPCFGKAVPTRVEGCERAANYLGPHFGNQRAYPGYAGRRDMGCKGVLSRQCKALVERNRGGVAPQRPEDGGRRQPKVRTLSSLGAGILMPNHANVLRRQGFDGESRQGNWIQDQSSWNQEMLDTIDLFTTYLSKTIREWEKFTKHDYEYFVSDEGESGNRTSTLKSRLEKLGLIGQKYAELGGYLADLGELRSKVRIQVPH